MNTFTSTEYSWVEGPLSITVTDHGGKNVWFKVRYDPGRSVLGNDWSILLAYTKAFSEATNKFQELTQGE